MPAREMQRWLVKLDDNIMFVINKEEKKCFVSYFLKSYRRNKILVCFNLYINENYYEYIITSI